MKKAKIYFERESWEPNKAFPFPELATENKVWVIKSDESPYTTKLTDRDIQQKIKREFTEKFSSVYFLGSTSVYFYFSDPADEALFVMYYSSEGFLYDYQI